MRAELIVASTCWPCTTTARPTGVAGATRAGEGGSGDAAPPAAASALGAAQPEAASPHHTTAVARPRHARSTGTSLSFIPLVVRLRGELSGSRRHGCATGRSGPDSPL